MNVPCSLHQFLFCRGATWIAFAINHDAVLCTNSRALLGSLHMHSHCSSFFCMCHGVGEYVHTKQRLKVKPLTASVRFIPVGVDCNSCYNHHMAGMANTAPRPCLFTLTQSHTHTLTHSLSLVLVFMIKSKELKTKIYHTHSLILSLWTDRCWCTERAARCQ